MNIVNMSDCIQKRMATGVMVAAILFGITFSFATPAKAQTTEEAMLVQIGQLLALIADLQEQLLVLQGGSSETSSDGGFIDRSIAVGDTVETSSTLKVRSQASIDAALLAVQDPETSGVVARGPAYSDGYTWWWIQYENGISGWSAGNWLKRTGPSFIPDPTDGEEDQFETEGTASVDVNSADSAVDPVDDEEQGQDQNEEQAEIDRLIEMMSTLNQDTEDERLEKMVELRHDNSAVDEVAGTQGETLQFQYYPEGWVEECTVTNLYSDGVSYQYHYWDGSRITNQNDTTYGVVYAAVSTVDGTLESVTVDCEMEGITVSDSIEIDVDSRLETKEYTFVFNGEELSSSPSVNEGEAYQQCHTDISDSDGSGADVAECYWGDDLILTSNSWKG